MPAHHDLAEWVGHDGSIEVFDLQQEMLDHTIRRAREKGLWNVNPTRGDAQDLPYEDDSFDAAILITVLGEIPDQDAALREIARVLRPGGRLIVGAEGPRRGGRPAVRRPRRLGAGLLRPPRHLTITGPH